MAATFRAKFVDKTINKMLDDKKAPHKRQLRYFRLTSRTLTQSSLPSLIFNSSTSKFSYGKNSEMSVR
ncbi:hypothetical protein ACH3XW_42895 [Acanthocheilonema viteae]